MSRIRVAFNALDLAVYRRVLSFAHRPQIVRWVRRYSRLGEHGAVWLALGATGATFDGERRRRWVRATAVVGAAYAISTSIKLAIGRRRPELLGVRNRLATQGAVGRDRVGAHPPQRR